MERPILFNSLMVQAILEGKKTCTRRIIKDIDSNYGYLELANNTAVFYRNTTKLKLSKKMPYQVGDILYVRETWLKADDKQYYYRADETPVSKEAREDFGYKWKPSIHMPKDAARIFLEVTDVRAERLQDITEDEAIKEGIRAYTKDGEVFKYAVDESQYKWSEMPGKPIEPFKKLWDSCYNWPKCWDYNPWVWVIEFKRIER